MTQALPQPLTMRFHQGVRAGAFALVAAASFFASSASSFAGPAEVKALEAALGKTIATATTTELLNAYNTVTTANARLKKGVVVGEILRLAGSSAPDIGTQMGLLFAAAPDAEKVTVAADAARTAGGAKGNVARIPEFAANLNITNALAIQIASVAKSARAGSSAILGGRASQLSDPDAIAFANSVLLPANKLTGNAQDIARFISATVADGVVFTTQVAGLTANAKIADRIVFGTVAGIPTMAGAIVDAALNIPGASGKPNLLVPRISGMLKTVGAFSDIEQIQKVAVAVSARIGLPATNINRLKLSTANSIASTLAKAIVAKPKGTHPTADLGTPFQNRVDELGELAASILAGIATNPDFTRLDSKGAASTASKTLVSLLRTITGAARSKTPGTTGPLMSAVVSYVSGSLALTVANLPGTIANSAAVKTALTNILQDAKTIDGLLKSYKITGADVTNIKAGIAFALANPGGSRFENGFDTGTLGIPGITDPETNSRNL